MYKKYLSVSIMMLAPMCANAGGDYTAAIQQLDAEIARLQAQNQAGLEELQECEKKVKGFKISGITTLSLTGVGIGVNIGEAVKLNKLEKQSSALDASIAEKQAEIQRQREKVAATGPGDGSGAEQNQEEEAEAQQQQSQQPVSVKEKSGNEEDKSAKKVTDTRPAEKKDDKKTSTPASKSGTQKTNQPSTTPKPTSGNSEKTVSVKEFLLSKVKVNGTESECWDFNGDKTSTTKYVKKKGDWATVFDYGVITGVAKCSKTSGEKHKPGNPQDDTGEYCWCKMTQLKKTGETNFLPAGSRWVFNYSSSSAAGCASLCADDCERSVRRNSGGFRAAVFGGVN